MRENILSEKTLLPLGLVGSLIMGVVWIANVHFQTSANAVSIVNNGQRDQMVKQELESSIHEVKADLKTDLIRIEGKVDKLLLRKN